MPTLPGRSPSLALRSALLLAGSLFLAPPVHGQDTAQYILVAPNKAYDAGALRRGLFGGDYRDLWVVPTKVEVLNLGTYAGGLTPVRVGGGQQTKSLRFRSADGREFNFRSIDKDPVAVLPEDLKQTIAADIVQDQISSALPAGPLVVDQLLTAAGVLHVSPAMFVMPDDPRLGEFRAQFAGMLGMLEENPNEGLKLQVPGLQQATKIIDMDKLLDRLEDDGREHIDTLAFLRARLMDVFMGDWDRHRGQWKWARIGPDEPGTPWVPVPEDRDQAFIRYDGFLLSVARHTYPQLVNYGDDYALIRGATYNGRELDRRLLESLDRPIWDSIAGDLQRRLTDAVIDSAVRRLPIQEYRIVGDRLAYWLKARRDKLRVEAGKYYAYLAEAPELHATDESDVVTIVRLPGDKDEVEIRMLTHAEGGDVAQAQRTFRPSDTDEIRVYLHGGADTVRVSGPGGGNIQVRVIGGDGDDVVIDSSAAGRIRMYDTGDHTVISATNKVRLSKRRYVQPDTTTKVPPIDWGGFRNPLLWASANPDVGLFLGFGVISTRYGFRKDPWSKEQILRAGWALEAKTYRAEYQGTWHHENRMRYHRLLLRASGIEVLRFHGLGNESPISGGDDFYKVESNQFLVEPSMTWMLGSKVDFTLGARALYNNTEANTDHFISTIPNLYGFGNFGEAGARMGITVDTRDVRAAARKGILLNLEGTVYPELWDVQSTFGKVAGQASTYLSAGPATLALRAGGEKVFGDFPWFESAFMGGRSTIRGWHEQRFAGDASAYGNGELRLHLGRMMIVVPADVGVFGLADAGRVYLDGETSDEWHTSFGGGLSLGFLSRANTISLAVARSDERTGFYMRAGFLF